MGIVSRSGALTARDQILETGLGIVAQPFPAPVGGVGGTLGSGVAFALAVGCRGGDVLTSMVTWVTTGGAGTQPTLIRQGVADSTGKMLAVTADSHASAVWTSGGTASVVALTAPLTIPTEGLYYNCIIQVGAFGTTALNLGRPSAATGGFRIGAGPFILAAQTGLADLPAVNSSLVLASGSSLPYWLAAV